jgi:hypothetical protein
MSVLRDSICLFINRIVVVVIILATDVIVSRYLGPEYKGYYVILYLTPVMLATAASQLSNLEMPSKNAMLEE